MGTIALLLAGCAAVLVALAALETVWLARAAIRGRDAPGARYPATWRPLSLGGAVRRTLAVRWGAHAVTLASLMPGGPHALAGAWCWTAAVWVGIVASAALAEVLNLGWVGELLVLGLVIVAVMVVNRRGERPAKHSASDGGAGREHARLLRALGSSPRCPRCAERAGGEWGLCEPCSQMLKGSPVPRSDARIWGDENGVPLPLSDGPPVVWGSLLGEAFLLQPEAYNGLVDEARRSAKRPATIVAAAWDPADAGRCWISIAVDNQRRLVLSGFSNERLASVIIAWAGRAPDGGDSAHAA